MGFFKDLKEKKLKAKKQEIRDLFDANVEDGQSYKVLAAMNLVIVKKAFKYIDTYYNYIIGYRDGDDPEIVVIATDSELSGVDDPVFCKKSECRKAVYSEATCGFKLAHRELGRKPVSFNVIASQKLGRLGKYIIKVSYVDEFLPFLEFFKTRFLERPGKSDDTAGASCDLADATEGDDTAGASCDLADATESGDSGAVQ